MLRSVLGASDVAEVDFSVSPSSKGVLRRGGDASQFLLLLLLVVFVGAVVGVERSVLPLMARRDFGIASATATLSFLVAFGFAKALANGVAGDLASRIGRRRVLILSWLFGLPVPLVLLWAPSWGWVGVANLFLGVNQGLAWSSLQIMKIDLVNRDRRGLAMGANECAGYVAVAAAALTGGLLATAYGPRFALFAIPFPAVLLGLLLTITFLRDTSGGPSPVRSRDPFGRRLRRFRQLSFGTRSRVATHLGGLVVNLKEGVAWGLLPLYFSARGLAAGEIAWLVSLYPGVWGLTQLATGSLSDHWGRRPLIIGGLLAQAVSLVLFASLDGLTAWTCAAIVLGLGTAATYPTLIAQASELAGASYRADAIGTYRLWRDLGYVCGALSAGIAADVLGFSAAIVVVAALLAGAAVLTRLWLPQPEIRLGWRL